MPRRAFARAIAARARPPAPRRARFDDGSNLQGAGRETTPRALEQDPAIDDAQRRQRLAALDARLPASVRAEREAPLAVVRLEEAAQRIRADGGSEDDVYRMRAAATSPEAANRLADLDREEAAWKARIAAYRSQRAAVLSAPGGDAERAAAIGELRDRLFTPDEQRRLVAYEG